jgi:hypothetical protein
MARRNERQRNAAGVTKLKGDKSMNGVASNSNSQPVRIPAPEVREAVRNVLTRCAAFAQLPPEKQQQIAHDTARIADYLAAPEGFSGAELPTAAALADAPESTYAQRVAQVNKVGGDFKAAGAREGAEVAGMLLEKVNFPTFVAGLIEGVFHAIVKATIEQMEAYGQLVASVAKSLNTFRDENVSENQGRDHLVDKFPDLFQISMGDEGGFGSGFGGGFGDSSGGPKVKLRDGVEEDQALSRINSSLPMEGGPLKSLDLEDEENEKKLVTAARTQLATSRQQLLATMVLMGINRIVITDGKIQAKIMYDFQARDNMRRQRSAAAFDFARDRYGNVQRTYGSEGSYESEYEGGETKGQADSDEYERRDANYYSKGTYKYSQQPIMTAMSTATEASEAALQTRAQLAGNVDINFKSDYFPLEKMADSFQIAQIQNASKPAGASGGAAPGPAQTPPATTAPATSATQPAK